MGNQDGDNRGYRAVVYESMKRLLNYGCALSRLRFANYGCALSRLRFAYASAVLVLIASPALLQTRASGQTAGKAPAAAEPNQHQAMLNTYCTGCHNNRAKVGGLAL